MKILIQRVKEASVFLPEEKVIKAKIHKGLLVFIGFCKEDTTKTEIDYGKIAKKTLNLRIFEDENKKMNLSVIDIQGQILLVSQFTLCGDPYQGNRPSFTNAMPIEEAKTHYEKFCSIFKMSYLELYKEKFQQTISDKTLDFFVQTGKFQAMMDIPLINDGPVTFYLEF
ncbi:MAG: D-aminoacyl-tRNA deacylase [Leptospiraceae bacterium]|nr:D-aminoacyl-tRNA deacylase [Leptospiraceae bacterium]MDW7977072.1 D-aminoacyl-tRNA deacylase [Leptospiraceae bacterium]